jgi:drug/metabolite transporter (DMT)-like permease
MTLADGRPPTGSSPRLFTASAAANTGAFTSGDWALFLSVAGIWGASFLFIDIGLDAFPPGVITLARVGLGAVTLHLVRGTRVRVDRADHGRLVALAVLWVAIPFTLFPLAEQRINSAVTGLLNGGTPIFTAVVATVLLRQRPRGAQLAGIMVGFAGVAAISLPSIGDGSSQALGVGLVVLATVCYGFAMNIAPPLQARYGSVPLMARVLALAALMTLPFGVAELGDVRVAAGPALAVSVLGILGTGIAFAIMATLVGRVGATRASFITYLVPVVSLVLGVVFRDDHVAAIAVVGVALVVTGAFLASRRA